MENRQINTLQLPTVVTAVPRAIEYSLKPGLPAGLSFDPNRVVLNGTPTQTITRTPFTFSATDIASGGSNSLVFDITVLEELIIGPINSMTFLVGEAIAELAFPLASGGVGDYQYFLKPDPPRGLKFEATDGRVVLRGTPAETSAPQEYTYRVQSAQWEAEQKFTIEVTAELTFAHSVDDQSFVRGTDIDMLVLPVAIGGRSPYRYTLQPLPDGLVFDSAARTLSGTPTEVWEKVPTTYKVTDAGGRTDTLTFDIEVLEGLGLAAIADQTYTIGEAIPALILPEASGGRGPYAYALSPEPPCGADV